MSLIDQMCFWDERAAARVFQAARWPEGAQCPSCNDIRSVRPLDGATTPSGSYKCYGCGRKFSVRTGSPLEGSHIPLSRWLRAILLIACAKRPVACKHLEEACDVAPRIARTLRQKLVQCIESPPTSPLTGLEDLARRLLSCGTAQAGEVHEPAAFADVCRAVGVPGALQEQRFLSAVQHVVTCGRIVQPPSRAAGAGGDPYVDPGEPFEGLPRATPSRYCA